MIKGRLLIASLILVAVIALGLFYIYKKPSQHLVRKTSALSAPELKYILADKYQPLFLCVTLGVRVDDQVLNEAYNEVIKDQDLFDLILKHNNLENVTDLNRDDKTGIYHDKQKLDAIKLTRVDDHLQFSLLAGSQDGSVDSVTGIINDQGVIKLATRSHVVAKCANGSQP